MIDKQIQTPGLNTAIVFSNDIVIREEDGAYTRKRGQSEMAYCINAIEEMHNVQFRMSPFNRQHDCRSEPYVQDTRQADVLKGALIVVPDISQFQGIEFIPANRSVFIPNFTQIASVIDTPIQGETELQEQDQEEDEYADQFADQGSSSRCVKIEHDFRKIQQRLAGVQEVTEGIVNKIKQADYVVIQYSDVLCLSATLKQFAKVTADQSEEQCIMNMGVSLGYNAFANPHLSSVYPAMRKSLITGNPRLNILRNLLVITGTIFKQVIYYHIPSDMFRGTVFGQLNYAILKNMNLSRSGTYSYRTIQESQVDIASHKRVGKRCVQVQHDPIIAIKRLLSDLCCGQSNQSFFCNSIVNLRRTDAFVFYDINNSLHPVNKKDYIKLPVSVVESACVQSKPSSSLMSLGNDLYLRAIDRSSIQCNLYDIHLKTWEVAQTARCLAQSNCLNLQNLMMQFLAVREHPHLPPQKIDITQITQRIDETCVICMNAIRVAVIAPCYHVVCSACFSQMQPVTQCPMCRRDYSIQDCIAVQNTQTQQLSFSFFNASASENAGQNADLPDNQDNQVNQDNQNAEPNAHIHQWSQHVANVNMNDDIGDQADLQIFQPHQFQRSNQQHFRGRGRRYTRQHIPQQAQESIQQTFERILQQEIKHLTLSRVCPTITSRLARLDDQVTFENALNGTYSPRYIRGQEDLTAPFKSDTQRAYELFKHILIPVFGINELATERLYRVSQAVKRDVQDIIVQTGITKGSATQFVTVSKGSDVQLNMPICILFIEDEETLLKSFAMNAGIQRIKHVIVPPVIELYQYANSEFCKKLCEAGINQTVIKPNRCVNQRNGYYE